MRRYIPNVKKLGPVVREICVPKNNPIFFTFFFFALFYSNFEPTKNTLPMDRIFLKFVTLIRHFVAYLSLKFGDV